MSPTLLYNWTKVGHCLWTAATPDGVSCSVWREGHNRKWRRWGGEVRWPPGVAAGIGTVNHRHLSRVSAMQAVERLAENVIDKFVANSI